MSSFHRVLDSLSVPAHSVMGALNAIVTRLMHRDVPLRGGDGRSIVSVTMGWRAWQDLCAEVGKPPTRRCMEVATVGGYLIVAVSGDVDPWTLTTEFVIGEIDLRPRHSPPLCDPEQMGEIIERLKRDHHLTPDGAMQIAHDLCFGVELEEGT